MESGGSISRRVISISTHDVSDREKLDYWLSAVEDGVLDLSATAKPFGDSFDCEIQGVVQERFGITRVKSSPSLILREPSRREDKWSDSIVTHFLAAGEVDIGQGERVTTLKAGEGTLLLAEEPYFVRSEGPIECIIMRLDRRLFSHQADLARLTAINFAQAKEVGALLHQYATHLNDGAVAFSPGTTARLADNFVDLLETTLSVISQESAPIVSSHRTVTLDRVKAFIQERLNDPNLSSSDIAEGTRLSARYLNKLFASEGTSLARYIWNTRLAQCASDLGDPRLRRDTIAVIAARRGFKDMSHFSRAFRLRFELSPRDFRYRFQEPGWNSEGAAA